MEIVDVKIRMMEGVDKMKAIASVNFEDEFVVHDIKVIEGKNGIFVVMPSKKVGKDKFVDVAHPLNSAVRMKLQKSVIDAYYTSLKEEFIDDEELDKRLDMDFDSNKNILNEEILNPLTIEFEGNKIEMGVSSDEIEVLHELYLDEEECVIEGKDFKKQLLEILVSKDRVLPGEELYINDFILNSKYNEKIAEDLKNKFKNFDIDCIVVLDDMSCILGYEVSKKLNLELLVVKRGANHNQGAAIAVNYFDERNETLKTLTLPKRSKLDNRSCLIIDSEIKDGCIIKGIEDLMAQFNCRLKGIGSLIDYTSKHKELPIYSYSLFRHAGVDDNDIPIIY